MVVIVNGIDMKLAFFIRFHALTQNHTISLMHTLFSLNEINLKFILMVINVRKQSVVF